MPHALRFQAFILANVPWNELLSRFRRAEALGFELAATGDHFVDWTNPANPWFELWTVLAAVSVSTSRIRIAPCVAQIPLRNPAFFAREALTVDHLSNGRLEVGLGLGLPIDPSYRMMGIPNWSNKERAARFKEYVEIVDSLLRNEETTYKGRFYEVDGAVMNPRPVQSPRPPITIAALGPRMIRYAARYADTWNTMSFAQAPGEQLDETRDRIAGIEQECAKIGRDPGSLRFSYNLFDPGARASGGRIRYYESPNAFVDEVAPLLEMGVSEFGLYYPMLEEQLPALERIATDVFPKLRAQWQRDRAG